MAKMRPEEANIVVDTSYSTSASTDSDSDRASYTSAQSLASSITRYRYENGRRYHAYRDGSYYAPNDEKYSNYETIVHHLWLLTLDDRLFLAPVDELWDGAGPQRILDVGTGTGLWAVDIADYFPSAQITATDLSPTQPTTAPPSISFEIDDATSDWTYPLSSFDYIHIRGLTGCIRDWPLLYAQAHARLQPGGWLEHLEFSVETNADPNSAHPAHRMYVAFSESILDLGDRTGMTFRTVDRMAGWMRDAGFVDVHERTFVWPIGAWPRDARLKELGRWGERNWADGLEGWVLALYTRVLGWTYEEVQKFVKDFRAVIKDRKNHFYHEVRCVYGRKPFPHEVGAAQAQTQAASGGVPPPTPTSPS